MYKPIDNEIFHVHTWRCKHAEGYSEEQYIQTAIDLGAERIVFTDHSPFPGNPFGGRMDIEQLPEYVSCINRLKVDYQKSIEVLCGLEVEYLPSFIDFIKELHDMPEIDLLIMGQHFYEHKSGLYSFVDEDKSDECIGLFDAMQEGAQTGLFEVIAHPDRAFRRRKQWSDKESDITKRFFDNISNNVLDIYLEHNISSLTSKKQYRKEFWDLSIHKNYVVGFDAHSLDDLSYKRWMYKKNFDGKLLRKS